MVRLPQPQPAYSPLSCVHQCLRTDRAESSCMHPVLWEFQLGAASGRTPIVTQFSSLAAEPCVTLGAGASCAQHTQGATQGQEL